MFNHRENISPETSRVLVTGASSGIGYCLSREFARHGHHLVVVAPVRREIEKIAKEISQEFNVRVEAIPCDLTHETAAEELFDLLSESMIRINILVNNTGLGQPGKFWENPLNRDIQMLRLNIEANVRLTRTFLPPMIDRGEGRILNTALVTDSEMGSHLALYHATKAFVLALSESLATELKDTGVSLTALCPAATEADFFETTKANPAIPFQRPDPLSPQEVAAAAYEGLINGERVVIPSMAKRGKVASRPFVPNATQAKINERIYTDIAPENYAHARDHK